MNKPVLVIMAAGMGSRYGGLKQIDPIGPNGQIILDYSVYDAHRAGFERVVFIIRPELHEAFEQAIGAKARRFMQVDYAYQTLDRLPEGLKAPEGREKPLGTAHAVWCAKVLTEGCPIAVINADDFYGGEAFKKIGAFLRNVKENGEKAHWAMVGYHLKNTLTENGHVARGVCVEKDGVLDTIVERTHIEKREDGPAYTEDDGATWHALDEDTTVSMNLWGFTPDFVDALKKDFVSFLENDVPKNPLKAEYFLPFVVNDQIRDGKADVTVLKSADKWFGVTYKADKPVVMAALAEMMQNGTYPDPLWK